MKRFIILLVCSILYLTACGYNNTVENTEFNEIDSEIVEDNTTVYKLTRIDYIPSEQSSRIRYCFIYEDCVTHDRYRNVVIDYWNTNKTPDASKSWLLLTVGDCFIIEDGVPKLIQ